MRITARSNRITEGKLLNDAGEEIDGSIQMVFDAQNHATPQSLTVKGIDDTVVDGVSTIVFSRLSCLGYVSCVDATLTRHH